MDLAESIYDVYRRAFIFEKKQKQLRDACSRVERREKREERREKREERREKREERRVKRVKREE